MSRSSIIDALRGAYAPECRNFSERWLDALDADGAGVVEALTGGLRVGVSARLAKQALAALGGVEVSESRVWHGQTPPYQDLFAWLEKRSDKPTADAPGRFRPVMLAQAVDEEKDFANYNATDYSAEWKWDGIRVQAVSETQDRRKLYSQTGDEIELAFPDVLDFLSFEGVIDGELLVMRNGSVASFGDLQQRLNRKSADAKLLAKYPASIRAYDLLLEGEEDLRGLSFRERRRRPGGVRRAGQLAACRPFALAAFLQLGRACAPARRSAGRRPTTSIRRPDAQAARDSIYEAGRPKGPLVQVEARPASDRCRAADVRAARPRQTFRLLFRTTPSEVWREDANGDQSLTPVGKAYFDFTDEEAEADR